ncbi:MAG: exodeoxyribonuclease III [Alphaproteobacteria bacterium]
MRFVIFGACVNPMMRICCWNVNSIKARLDHVLQYLSHYQPDILMLQELKTTEDNFPFLEVQSLGYKAYIVGQKTYNGVAIITKRDIEVEQTALSGGEHDEQARFIQILDKETHWLFINIYLPNGNPTIEENGQLHEKFLYKLAWMERLYCHLKSLKEADIPFLIAGDWNVAPYDSDAFDAKKWQDDALLHVQSRDAYFRILHLGLTDSLKMVEPKVGYTWWDYRNAGFKQDHGLRIDHILLSPAIANHLIDAGIDKDMRALEKPSDHAPIWVTLSSTSTK